MITFPVIEDQYAIPLLQTLPLSSAHIVCTHRASASIQMNITTVLELGNLWSSTSLKNFAASLMPDPITNANAGTLIGTKMFYANDYLVSLILPFYCIADLRTIRFIGETIMYPPSRCTPRALKTQNASIHKTYAYLRALGNGSRLTIPTAEGISPI